MVRKKLGLCLCFAAVLCVSPHAYAEECQHSFQTMETPATCVEPGLSYDECIFCGIKLHYANSAPLGHDYGQWVVSVMASCEKGGVELRACFRCGAVEQQETQAVGHDYQVRIIAPSCTIRGYTETVCTFCGDSSKSDYTEPTGHNYDVTVIEPTCTQGGYTQNTCRNCGHISQKWWKTALGHDYETRKVEPSETAQGYQEHTCTRCGESYRDSYTEPVQASAEPTNPKASESTAPETAERKSICIRKNVHKYPGIFWLPASGRLTVVDGLDPDISPLVEKIVFLWGFRQVSEDSMARCWIAPTRILERGG